jgi:ribosomal protein S18 acetylase RimI-like enzyme
MDPRVRVRPAEVTDHAAFVRLFPELGVDDPILDEGQFAHQLMPSTLLAEVGPPEDRRAVGYAYFQIMKETAFVRHIVTAPEARRTGVARALLAAIVERAREAGCSSWCLNVKPGNTPAIALYEDLGLRRAHTSRALHMTWMAIEAAPVVETRVRAKDIAPEEDSRVETATHLLEGQLAGARAVSGRVLKMLEDEEGAVVGATIFHPDFPGAYPFRVARPELALVLLRALRPHARPADAKLGVVTEDQPEVADALIAVGATVKLDSVHMKGPLPEA